MSSQRPIALTSIPSDETYVQARVSSDAYNQDFLFRLIKYESGTNLILGIVEHVGIPQDPKYLRIRNLRSLSQDGNILPVRDAPSIGRPVYFADDLSMFFPKDPQLVTGYLGVLRDTSYPLPFDLNKLCFANAAVLAGIGHGKSHLAAMLVAQYHLTGKKVLVLDPSGEWTTIMQEKRVALQKSAGLNLKVSCFSGDRIPILPGDPRSLGPNPPDWIRQMWKALNENNITVVDASLAHRRDLTVEMKQHARCEIAYHVQQVMMEFALSTYAKTRKSYSTPSCIVLEEAHQFVPARPQQEYQKLLCPLFSISTKEYRKFGLGHLFIDQSLKSIHEDLQIQTFLLGATTQPTDLNYLEEKLGSNVSEATRRTTPAPNQSWVAIGAATPITDLPWEIDGIDDKELGGLLQRNNEKSDRQ